MTIISGICPVEHLGAGRMVRWVEKKAPEFPNWKIVYASNKSGASACLRKRHFIQFPFHILRHITRRASLYRNLSSLAEEPHLLLLHFQEIGFDWCMRLLNRRSLTQPIWIYLFDSAFFCRKSYNHIEGENSECLRCLGGNFQEANRAGCVSYPRKSKKNTPFLEALHIAATKKRVAFLAQNEAQKQLAMRHFGPEATVETVGLWTDDIEELHHECFNTGAVPHSGASPFDVVFHGNPQATKGFFWAIEVARFAPHLSFLFPCRQPLPPVPSNCHFREMRWNSGLSEIVRSTPLTLVPSLWSAPVEGSLIKTFMVSPRVAVVDVPSSFSSEFDGSLILRLPQNPEAAAGALSDAVRSHSPISSARRESWLKAFSANCHCLQTIDQIIEKEPDSPKPGSSI